MVNTQAPSGIITPEAVVLEFDTAGAGSRLIAETLDILLQLTLLVIVFIAVALAATGLSGSDFGWIAIAVLFVLIFLVLLGYPIAMETLWNGKTLGKAAMGLRVVTEEGGPIRFRHAVIRGITGFFEIWLFQGLPALLAIILSKKNQRLGDMLAGTLVLRERTASGQAMAVAFPSPAGFEAYVSSLDVSSLSTDQYGVIRSFLMRVFELSPVARASLSVRLANPVATQLHHQPPNMVGPELFLACVAAAYQLRHGGPAAAWGVPAAPGGWGPPGPGGYPSAYPVAPQQPPPGYGPPTYGGGGYGGGGYGGPGYGAPDYGAGGYGNGPSYGGGPSYGAPIQ